MTAVAPVVIECDGLWVGWTGLEDYNPETDLIPESSEGRIEKIVCFVSSWFGLVFQRYLCCSRNTVFFRLIRTIFSSFFQGDLTPTSGLKSGNIVPVSIQSSRTFDNYYNGCCNATFWPLFHSMPDKAVFNIETWKSYAQVNEIFAEKTLDAVRKYKDSSR